MTGHSGSCIQTRTHTEVLQLGGLQGSLSFMTRFEWDEDKDRLNQKKHGVGFRLARYAFADPCRVIAEDVAHSDDEDRFFCIGRVGEGIMTVRFTYREHAIRIIGAGYWRKGKQLYEEQNPVHG